MGSFIAIGLLVLFFILSLFAKRFMRWKVMPFVYLACTVIIVVDAITGTTHRYISLFFILLGIYGIVKSLRESRAPDR
jgi:hypothetical protein